MTCDAAALGYYFINICLLKGPRRDMREAIVLSDARDVNITFREIARDAFTPLQPDLGPFPALLL